MSVMCATFLALDMTQSCSTDYAYMHMYMYMYMLLHVHVDILFMVIMVSASLDSTGMSNVHIKPIKPMAIVTMNSVTMTLLDHVKSEFTCKGWLC